MALIFVEETEMMAIFGLICATVLVYMVALFLLSVAVDVDTDEFAVMIVIGSLIIIVSLVILWATGVPFPIAIG